MDSKTSYTCSKCSQVITIEPTDDPLLAWSRQVRTICEQCIESQRVDDDAQQMRIADNNRKNWLKREWESLCPLLFQSTDLSIHPCPDEAQRCSVWDMSEGLILHGPTATGKSRAAWMAIGRAHFLGKSFMEMNGGSGLHYAALFSRSAEDAEAWSNDLIGTDVLLLDDVFKTKFTESFESFVFHIIDQRTRNGRPIIVTSNDTGATLTGRMTGDRGEPLVRRLREFCTTITFKAKA